MKTITAVIVLFLVAQIWFANFACKGEELAPYADTYDGQIEWVAPEPLGEHPYTDAWSENLILSGILWVDWLVGP